MALERIVIKLPRGYDPTRHEAVLPTLAAKAGKGDGWAVENIDLDEKTATLSRERRISEVTGGPESGALMVRLAAGTKPADGDKVAARYADQYPGYYLVTFEPFIGQATLARLTDDEARARGQISVALRCKPWEVQIAARPGGGFVARLPRYVPSQHDEKLAEAAVLIGRPGWYVAVNEKTLVAAVIPSELPTFPAMVELDLDRLGGDVDVTPFAMALPEPGQTVGETVAIDWTVSPTLLLGGLPNSGKFCVHETPVPVPASERFPQGWARHGDLGPGDQVIALDGTVVSVLGVSAEQEMDVAVVTFSDGQSVTVGMDHLWTVTRDSLTPTAQPRDVAPEEELRRLDTFTGRRGHLATRPALAGLARVAVDVMSRFVDAAGVPSPGADLYPVDETMAAWARHRTRFGPHDAPVLTVKTTRQLLAEMPEVTWAVPACSPVRLPPSVVPVDPYVAGAAFAATADATSVIPVCYARGSIRQRVEFLRGVMDVAGSVTPLGRVSLALPDSIGPMTSLIRSLGMLPRPGETPDTVVFEANQRVFRRDDLARAADDAAAMLEPRARLDPSTAGDGRWNRIISIEPAGRANARCILVDHPWHCYLVADHVPTHNTVTLNAIVADQVAAGAELVVIDTLDKSVDFEWVKPYVREGGWGCASLAAAVAALSIVYDEGKRRAEILREAGVKNWRELPPDQRFPPVDVIFDEVAAMLVMDRIPPGADKKSPDVMEIIELNRLKFKLFRLVYRIIAEQRFVRMRVVLSSQVTNQSTGLPPSVKALIGNKGLQGLTPSAPARKQGFDDDAIVPKVPSNVASDPLAGLGVGVIHLAGQKPVVYKSTFARDEDLAAELDRRGVPRTGRPEPTPEQVARYVYPSDEEAEEAEEAEAETFRSDFGRMQTPLDGDGRPLRGAAAASASSRLLAGAATDVQGAVLCPSCDRPIRDNGDCGCS